MSWSRTFLLLFGTVLLLSGCTSTPEAGKAIPLPTAPRRLLKICAAKSKLSRADLVLLARRYSLIDNGEPSIVEILKLNEKCRPSNDAEQLDLTRAGCFSEVPPTCKTGLVLIPIR
jgi:hypothetical protein